MPYKAWCCRTLLQLLARISLPTRGIVVYPQNLRVRYIPAEPLMFDSTLLNNLQFGNQKPHREPEIWALCDLLGMGKEVLHKSNLRVGLNGAKLSLTNRVFVCLTRALLSSVDLLFLAGTVDMLSPADGMKVIKVLQIWRDNRGLPCLPCDNPEGVDKSLKKNKTCFFISKNPDLETVSDATLMMLGDAALEVVQNTR